MIKAFSHYLITAPTCNRTRQVRFRIQHDNRERMLKHRDFLESVWCEIRLPNMDKILIGVYKSPNCNIKIHRKLNDYQLRQI